MRNTEKKMYYNGMWFNEKQMREIRIGQQLGIDISLYADSRFNADQMEQIRDGLDRGLNASLYADPKYPWHIMDQCRIALLYDLDITSLLEHPELSDTQAIWMRKGMLIEQKGYTTPWTPDDWNFTRRYYVKADLEDGYLYDPVKATGIQYSSLVPEVFYVTADGTTERLTFEEMPLEIVKDASSKKLEVYMQAHSERKLPYGATVAKGTCLYTFQSGNERYAFTKAEFYNLCLVYNNTPKENGLEERRRIARASDLCKIARGDYNGDLSSDWKMFSSESSGLLTLVILDQNGVERSYSL